MHGFLLAVLLAADPNALSHSLIEAAKQSRSESMLLLRDGKTVVSFRPEGKAQVQSVTKVFVNLAAGLLIGSGKLRSVDMRLGELCPEFASDPKGQVTLRQLLSHTSGIEDGKDERGINLPEFRRLNDYLGYARQRKMKEEPGTKYRYNNVGILLASYALEQVAGQRLEKFLETELLRPMGISSASWFRDRSGRVPFFLGLEISGEDLAKIGQLMLDEGRWQGKQLLPAQWVKESTRFAAFPEINPRMGLCWFLQPSERPGEPTLFQHSGDGGNWLIVLPGMRAVVVRLRNMQGKEDSFENFPQRAVDVLRASQ